MATLYNPRIITDGLVLCLDAANAKSYPGSGTTWYDLSGNENDGTLLNDPIYSANYFSFDGTNDYVNLNFPFTQSSSDYSYTVIILTKLSTTKPNRRQVWSSDNGGYDWGFGAGDGTKFTIFSGSNIHSGRTQDTNWHIFTAQWSSFGTRLYIDNTLDISVETIGYDNSISSNTNIARNPGYGEYWEGDLSFVSMYNRALSQEEIEQNFQALRGRYGI